MRPLFPLRAGSAAFSIVVLAVSACTPTAVIGTRFCQDPPALEGGAIADPTVSISLPWSTGFEDGLCDYGPPAGFCYALNSGTYALVTSPVHSGHYAAAFQVQSDVDGGSQVRCVLQGALVATAYYGAWYYVPAPVRVGSGVWNLFHFLAGSPEAGARPIWDISLGDAVDGGNRSTLYDFNNQGTTDAGGAPPIPIAQWFHLEVYFKHANDNMGEISLFQDGALVAHIEGIKADDSPWAQWYVGNYAEGLQPPAPIVVYVDDVTVSTSP